MKVFTTGQVAKICKVAPRTVSKWFDSGRLKGFRVPGSQDRRIPREYLIRFLKEHGMPLGELEDDQLCRVMIVSDDQTMVDHIRRGMPDVSEFHVEVATSSFEAGVFIESLRPHCLLIDYTSIGPVQADQICQNMRRKLEFDSVLIVAIVGEEHTTANLTQKVIVNEMFKVPFDSELLVARLRSLIDIKKDEVA